MPPPLAPSDWALLFGAVIALAQIAVSRVSWHRHRRRVADWEDETSKQSERLLRALRLCRQAEERCVRRLERLERRLHSIEEFHGPGKCYPHAEDWEPPDEPGWPMDDPGRWG